MEVSKVADYCKQKLADHDVHLTPVPLYWSTRQQGHQVGTTLSDECLQCASGHPSLPEKVSCQCWRSGAASQLQCSNVSALPQEPPIPESEAGLELLCQGKVGFDVSWTLDFGMCSAAHVFPAVLQAVYFDFTLSAVKKYIWRRSDDVVFNYRLYKPHRRAPPPLIKPPV